MTLATLSRSPIGTTEIASGENENWKPDLHSPEMKFMAVHYEKMQARVKPVIFYAGTETEALTLATAYDNTRKEIHKKWKDSAKERRTKAA